MTQPPSPHDTWVTALLGGDPPRETKSTCSDCAMCSPPGQPAREGAFDPQVKCCSYHPDIPNYLVGGVLGDADARADRMRTAIARGTGVTPLGLGQPAPYRAVYEQAAGAFGRAHALRCPWYVDEHGGRCGIWRHRPSVCATYFCKFERGAVSHAFWTALRNLLVELEYEVSMWCALQLDAAHSLGTSRSRAQQGISLADLDGDNDARARQLRWGAWFGREEEYFLRCAELAATLELEAVLALAGPRLSLLAERARSAYHTLSVRHVPERLVLGTVQLQHEAPGRVRAGSYLGTDPTVMPVTLASALLAFDGQPTHDVNAQLARSHGITLSASLLQRLVDFRVLVPAPEVDAHNHAAAGNQDADPS